MSFALGRWNTGYTRKRPRGQGGPGVDAVLYKCSGGNQGNLSLSPHPLDPMSSQWYVKVNSLTRSPKRLRIFQVGLIKSLSNIQSPQHTPPSPRHHFLAAKGHRI